MATASADALALDTNCDGVYDSLDTNGDGLPDLQTSRDQVTVPASCQYTSIRSPAGQGGSGGAPGTGGAPGMGGAARRRVAPATAGSGRGSASAASSAKAATQGMGRR